MRKKNVCFVFTIKIHKSRVNEKNIYYVLMLCILAIGMLIGTQNIKQWIKYRILMKNWLLYL